MVPESEKPRKNLAAGAARLLESPQKKDAHSSFGLSRLRSTVINQQVIPPVLVDPDLNGAFQIAARVCLPNPVEQNQRVEDIRLHVKDVTGDLVPLRLAHAEDRLVDRCRPMTRSHFFGIAVTEKVLGE